MDSRFPRWRPESRPGVRILTVNGMSITFTTTSRRVGYAGGPRDLIDAMAKLRGQSTTKASSVGKAAVPAALALPRDFPSDCLERCTRRRNLLERSQSGSPGREYRDRRAQSAFSAIAAASSPGWAPLWTRSRLSSRSNELVPSRSQVPNSAIPAFSSLVVPRSGRPRNRLLPDSPKACARPRYQPQYSDPHQSILSFWIKSKAKHIILERHACSILNPAAALASTQDRLDPYQRRAARARRPRVKQSGRSMMNEFANGTGCMGLEHFWHFRQVAAAVHRHTRKRVALGAP